MNFISLYFYWNCIEVWFLQLLFQIQRWLCSFSSFQRINITVCNRVPITGSLHSSRLKSTWSGWDIRLILCWIDLLTLRWQMTSFVQILRSLRHQPIDGCLFCDHDFFLPIDCNYVSADSPSPPLRYLWKLTRTKTKRRNISGFKTELPTSSPFLSLEYH